MYGATSILVDDLVGSGGCRVSLFVVEKVVVTKKLILVPGAKRRLLEKLKHLVDIVEHDYDREIIMFRASEIMPTCVSDMNYYNVALKRKE